MSGLGSLAGLMPYANANALLLDMAAEVLPLIAHTPVIAGVCATDPTRRIDKFLKELKERGFAGVQNFPTVGLIDGGFRTALEETGMGFGNEVEMVREAGRRGLLTCPYVFDPEQARAMVDAGADIVVAHMGLTTGGSIGAMTGKTLEACVEEVGAIVGACEEAGRRRAKDGDAEGEGEGVIVLCHGGPIARPEDAERMLREVRGLHGFFGASSVERLPVEEAIKGTMERFKGIQIERRV